MARRITLPPAEARRRKAQEHLKSVGYTPLAARLVGDVLLAIRIYDTPETREAKLRAFSQIVKGK